MLKSFYEKTTVDEKLEVIKKVKKNLEEIKDLEIDIENLKKQREALTNSTRVLNMTDWGRHDNDSRTISLGKEVGLLVVEYALKVLENKHKELLELFEITKGED